MGMVVIQPYILVSKLKKIMTKFLRCTGYLNSIKKTIKQDLLLVLVRQQSFLLASEFHHSKNLPISNHKILKNILHQIFQHGV